MGNFSDKALNVAISRIPQTNYLTGTSAAASSFVREELKQRTLPNHTASERDNADYATGFGQPTESWMEELSNGWPWSFDVSAENIGRYLLAAMGGVTTTQPDAGGHPTVYQHVFAPLDVIATAQLPAYSLLAQLLPGASGINKKLPSMVARNLRLSSSGTAKLDGSIDWAGAGEETDPSGVTWASHVNEIQGTQHYFFAKQAELITSNTDGSSPVDEKCELKSCSFGIDNQLIDNDFGCPRFKNNDPALGAIRSHHLLDRQNFSMEFTIKMRANNPHHTALINRTPFRIVKKWIGGTISGSYKYSLEITSYLSKYAAVETGFEDGMTVVRVTPRQLFNVSQNKIVDVKLINTVASYTA
ncbi:MAG: hypothetical protein IPM50_02610 [Acidobacteriota bacterium]|nr:MAG: hypothetical protein IPM50_02610 [Acidobacteriota bacterium]